jgi:hypothetical protein
MVGMVLVKLGTSANSVAPRLAPTHHGHAVVSEGMLFDIGYADGIAPVLAVPESPVPDGTRAG